MNRMLGYLKGYERESVLAPLFKMLEATFDLFVPLVMADIVNVGIAAHDLHYILVRCGLLLLLAFIGLTCSLTAQYFSAKAAVGYSTALRHALFAHIQSLSFSEMDTLGTSTLITRMTSDINQVQSGLNLFLRLFLRSPFVVLGAMVMAFTVNARAAMIFVVTIPLLSVVVFGVMVITRPLYKTVQTRLDRVLGLTRENLTGVRVVRAFDKEQSEIDRFEDANALLTGMQLHVGHLSALMNPLTYVLINLAIVALLYVGSIEINVGGMASGDVIALVNYMNQILVELVKLANLIVQISKALACAGRVQAVLDTKPGMTFPAKLLGEVPADKTGDAVRFDHVGLTYAGAGAPSLTDISFTAKKGQTIGVIGGTGSGKSSLVNLIPRFYDATEGSVEIFGPQTRVRFDVNGICSAAQRLLHKSQADIVGLLRCLVANLRINDCNICMEDFLRHGSSVHSRHPNGNTAVGKLYTCIQCAGQIVRDNCQPCHFFLLRVPFCYILFCIICTFYRIISACVSRICLNLTIIVPFRQLFLFRFLLFCVSF